MEIYLTEFVERGCPVIPVLLANAPSRPDLPLFLKPLTWVDLRATDSDPVDKIVWGITGWRSEATD